MIERSELKLSSYLIAIALIVLQGYTALLGGYYFALLPALLCFTLIGLNIDTATGFYQRLLLWGTPLSISIPIVENGLKLSLPTEAITLILFTFLFIQFFTQSINLRYTKHSLSVLLIIDVLYSLSLCLISEEPIISLKRSILKLIFLVVYYFSFITFFQKNTNKTNPFSLYAIGLIIPIIYTLMTHSSESFSIQSSYLACKPFFVDHTIYGAVIAFILPFFLVWVKNNFSYNVQSFGVLALVVLLFAALVLSFSRAALLSLLVSGIFLFLLRFRIKTKHILITLTILLTYLSFNYDNVIQQIDGQNSKKNETSLIDHFETSTNINSDVSNLERLNRWVCALRMFEEKPLFGYGPATYETQYDKFQTSEYLTRIGTHFGDRGNAHSEYLGSLAETGIIGLIILLIIAFYTIHLGLINYYFFKANRAYNTVIQGILGGLITIYTHNFFNSFMDSDKMAILVYSSYAMLLIIDIKRRTLVSNQIVK